MQNGVALPKTRVLYRQAKPCCPPSGYLRITLIDRLTQPSICEPSTEWPLPYRDRIFDLLRQGKSLSILIDDSKVVAAMQF
jgi:hypothetical protein